jgi:hypothetical protein
MKTLTYDLCEHEAQGETFEDWMEALKPHYMSAHTNVTQQHAGTPEEMKTAMGKWMGENKTRFDAAYTMTHQKTASCPSAGTNLEHLWKNMCTSLYITLLKTYVYLRA